MATKSTRPPADPAPTATTVLDALRRFCANAFPDSPGAAVVIVPAPGVPAVVLSLAADAVPLCITTPGLAFVS